MPTELSSAAILAVVLRVHLSPPIGSPAVSCFISSSMRAITAGVFFHCLAATASLADPFNLDVLLHQLSPPPGHGANIESEQRGDPRVAAASRLQGFQPSVEASLLLIEHA